MKTLVVGVGNPIRGDDGIGLVVAEMVSQRLHGTADFLPFSGSGLDLLGFLKGYTTVVLIDSIVSEQVSAGTCCELEPSTGFPIGKSDLSSHNAGILDAFELGRRLGIEVPAKVRIFGIGIEKAESFQSELSDRIRERIPTIVDEITEELEAADA
jgi:hydrogenase maturation protease